VTDYRTRQSEGGDRRSHQAKHSKEATDDKSGEVSKLCSFEDVGRDEVHRGLTRNLLAQEAALGRNHVALPVVGTERLSKAATSGRKMLEKLINGS